ncbi:glucosamine-fructose-6-phosphate aminotransferase [Clonorchis sinensis]|uniref:Glucosamine-fructose-6-phosphate aminotransferase n=1 Tax=Clonorchis sinensis TaxID=79923 RepID=G7Y3Z1_CLOSI|nr:glucosamine-fructose-6-phosphate aminotransferase [Clonorchis sinensis]
MEQCANKLRIHQYQSVERDRLPGVGKKRCATFRTGSLADVCCAIYRFNRVVSQFYVPFTVNGSRCQTRTKPTRVTWANASTLLINIGHIKQSNVQVAETKHLVEDRTSMDQNDSAFSDVRCSAYVYREVEAVFYTLNTVNFWPHSIHKNSVKPSESVLGCANLSKMQVNFPETDVFASLLESKTFSGYKSIPSSKARQSRSRLNKISIRSKSKAQSGVKAPKYRLNQGHNCSFRRNKAGKVCGTAAFLRTPIVSQYKWKKKRPPLRCRAIYPRIPHPVFESDYSATIKVAANTPLVSFQIHMVIAQLVYEDRSETCSCITTERRRYECTTGGVADIKGIKPRSPDSNMKTTEEQIKLLLEENRGLKSYIENMNSECLELNAVLFDEANKMVIAARSKQYLAEKRAKEKAQENELLHSQVDTLKAVISKLPSPVPICNPEAEIKIQNSPGKLTIATVM